MREKTRSLISKALVATGTAVLIIGCLVAGNKVEHEYTMSGIVRWKSDNVLTIEDTTGNLWDYEVDEDTAALQEKDKVRIRFHDNNSTGRRIDDQILEIIKR